MLAPSWVGTFGLVAALLAWSLATIVWRAGAARAPNRRLASLLAAEGLVAAGGTGVLYLTDHEGLATIAQLATCAAMAIVPLLNLRLLALLDTPLARPFGTRTAGIAMLVAGLAGIVSVVARPDLFVVDLHPAWYAALETTPGPGFFAFFALFTLVNLFALVAALHAHRRTRGTAADERSRAFLVAFGARDALVIVAFALEGTFGPGSLAIVIGPAVVLTVYVPLMAYGILRGQIFDIDLRLKAGLRRGTIALAFLAVFFVVSETVESIANTRWGPVYGIVAAAALALAGDRLQTIASRAADAAMPGVHDAPAYVDARKEAVYRTAVVEAWESGSVTEKERRLLDHLRASLGLDATRAEGIEREVRAA